MNQATFFKRLDENLMYADFGAISKELKLQLDQHGPTVMSKMLLEFVYPRFTHGKGDFFAKFLEVAIRLNTDLAQIEYPENYLFRLGIITGSMPLYECFVEEGVLPLLKDKEQEKQEDYFMELYMMAEQVKDAFFEQYEQVIKGLHYNGTFGVSENNERHLLINIEDYNEMEQVVHNYNTIVGRRDIVKDLEERAGI